MSKIFYSEIKDMFWVREGDNLVWFDTEEEARASDPVEKLRLENARLRNVIVDALEIILEKLPGEFDVWVIAASAALKGDE